MIDSILYRYTDPVSFHNIKQVDNLITLPSQIKQHVQDHFENWTKANSPNNTEWLNWKSNYDSITKINPQ